MPVGGSLPDFKVRGAELFLCAEAEIVGRVVGVTMHLAEAGAEHSVRGRGDFTLPPGLAGMASILVERCQHVYAVFASLERKPQYSCLTGSD
jgi:hypothetical protein